MKLDKFSGFISQIGNEMNKQSEELSQNQKIVDPSVDMQIFIETNKSQNDYASKETYVTYDESIHLASSGRTESTASDINPYMDKAPELTPDEQFKLEH